VDSCAGSNALLQEGAYAALSGWDVVKLYEPLYPNAVANRMPALRKTQEMPAPKVAQSQEIPAAQAAASQSATKNPIDNWDKSTYSVINKRPANLSDQENSVLDLLSSTPCMIDSVLDGSDLPAGTVQSILTRLAIKGLVRQYPDGRISLK
jgi:predicted Rossmann fold nucleotide-binding protein DprA/Smf involved in DNA uptake